MAQVSILIVDDHAIVRESLHALLITTFHDCHLLEANNGEDAVRLALTYHPDVIVMDIKMPQMSGLDATRQIKAACPQIKVVIHSNYTESVHQQAAREAGADDFVAKGRPDNALQYAILRLLPVETQSAQ